MSEQRSQPELSEQSRTYWKRHIENWRSSGLSQANYCRQHELKIHQFSYRKRRFIEADRGTSFVPIPIRGPLPQAPDRGSAPLRLVMDKDLAIEIHPDFDPRLLRRLIATLRSLS